MPANEVELVLNQAGDWEIAVTNEISPEHGGGSRVSTQDGGNEIYKALDVLRRMLCNLELEDLIMQHSAETDAAIARGDMLICYPLKPLPCAESESEPEPN
jgi:hypothetical protein